MSYYYREPKYTFQKVTFNSSDYLYIHMDDPSQSEREDQTSFIYIELKNFFLKKEGKILSLGNHLGFIYTMTGQTESSINDWFNRIKKTIGFP